MTGQSKPLNYASLIRSVLLNCSVCALPLVLLYQRWKQNLKAQQEKGKTEIIYSKKASKRETKIGVDRVFLQRFLRILPIIIPGILTPEFGYLVLVGAMMILRTICDLWMLRNGINSESSIINRDKRGMLYNVGMFASSMIPIAFVNCLLKFGLQELALRFRKRLTEYFYKEYLKGFTFYKVTNLDNRISNADQLLTHDVDKFCTSVAELYSNLSKPILDVMIYARRLTNSIGIHGPIYMLLYLAFSGTFLTQLRRPLGNFTVAETQLEGEFRFVNSRIITNSEEIAFYAGNGLNQERKVVRSTFQRLVDQLRTSMQFRFLIGIVDNIVAKYSATVVGYIILSGPFLNLEHPRHINSSHTERMKDYYRNGRMLINMAMAIGRIVLAGRELTRLAGFTARVTEFMDVLRDLNEKGIYKRTMVVDPESPPLVPNSGKIVHEDHLIRLDKVPIVTPNGDVLIKEMSFEVKSGMNVLVAGPNGAGKSSLFRTIGELWPLFGGVLTKPSKEKLFYVPQKPYLTLGTLRDQVIYPHTYEEFKQKGLSDRELKVFMEQVQLGYLVEREEKGWDACQDWLDVLSGGEKQRIAMARLFYHKPQFAILDECTSAVSVDVEGFMYKQCRTLGITLFTVSHRKSLWQYHEYVLQMDGRGSYSYQPISNETEVFGS